MASVRVERLDHCGVMAAVIKDLGLMDRIDARLVPEAQAVVTPGAAVAGMIRNGLGFANRPLSWTPQLFAHTPLALLCRDGRRAEMFNRLKLGRTLDEADAYGCDLLVQALALAVWAHAGMDLRVNHLDPTSVALSGEYIPERDEHALHITHGSSKEHRPDVKQAVVELMVSPDGGVPLVSQRWDGHTSDPQMFQERAQTLMTAFKTSPSPRSLLADAKRDTEDNAATLHGLGFLTRLANTIGLVSHPIEPALTRDTWQAWDETPRDQGVERCPEGRAQRWRVVYAQAARERAEATINNAKPRDDTALEQPRWHWQAQRFSTPEAAQDALARVAQRWQEHPLASFTLLAHKRDAGTGRPTPSTPRQDPPGPIQAHGRPAEEAMGHQKQRQACVVRGPPIGVSELSDPAVMAAYTRQSRVEGGFRWLNDPLCCVSSWCVKKPCRIQGRLLVMT